jgi:hypothetical protein
MMPKIENFDQQPLRLFKLELTLSYSQSLIPSLSSLSAWTFLYQALMELALYCTGLRGEVLNMCLLAIHDHWHVPANLARLIMICQ